MTARYKGVTGPTPEDVETCRRYVNEVLPMDSSLSTTLTTLRPDLFSAWLKQAGDEGAAGLLLRRRKVFGGFEIGCEAFASVRKESVK